MSLAAYRNDGTWVPLDDAPEISFRITEPGAKNVKYQCALWDFMPEGEDSPMSLKIRALREVFVAVCVLEARGLETLANGSGPPTIVQFFEQHPLAIEELMEKAGKLGVKAEAATADAVGNSPGASPGI